MKNGKKKRRTRVVTNSLVSHSSNQFGDDVMSQTSLHTRYPLL